MHASGAVTQTSSSSASTNARKRSRMTTLLNRNLETDSENEDEDDVAPTNPQKPWLAEFGRYLDTVEAVPTGMDIVEWWGVSSSPNLMSYNLLMSFTSSMLIGIQHGRLLQEITSLLWHLPFPVNVPFHPPESPSASAAIASRETLWRLYSA